MSLLPGANDRPHPPPLILKEKKNKVPGVQGPDLKLPCWEFRPQMAHPVTEDGERGQAHRDAAGVFETG